jgi:hypothetical protein
VINTRAAHSANCTTVISWPDSPPASLHCRLLVCCRVLGQRVVRDAALSTLQQHTRQAAATATAANAHSARPVLPDQLPGGTLYSIHWKHDADAQYAMLSAAASSAAKQIVLVQHCLVVPIGCCQYAGCNMTVTVFGRSASFQRCELDDLFMLLTLYVMLTCSLCSLLLAGELRIALQQCSTARQC